ncbi:hypothetical protein [uncultured Pseudodesulfovibrio sp.]|uniref:hypothetical protein n=1 Tax=uncultured Pseudodesulfovibrio sp. TaxID=2035858 RepID=UPI0029C7FCE4|nr:hypothetical protein [uncultured Pseudodesulfovibrio sp.]
MNNVEPLNIRMRFESKRSWACYLQKGFFLDGLAGMTVRDFLHEVLRFGEKQIETEVRTVFLNSSPVDDIDTTYAKDGDRLALGGAMPGLVGICMGRDNPYKSFRSDIVSKSHEAQKSSTPVCLFIKIFSTLAVDVGPDLLARGIMVDATGLADFLEGKDSLLVSGTGDSSEDLIESLRSRSGKVFVTVQFE